MNKDARAMLTDLFDRALTEMDPGRRVREFLNSDDAAELHGDRPIYLLAVGKAAVPMASAAIDELGVEKDHTLVISSELPYDPPETINVHFGSHPLPDESSLEAGRAAVDFVGDIPGDAVFLVLVSGGTSSLLALPASGISVEDLAVTYKLLLECGSGIDRINTVRKSLSGIKGGKLLSFLNPKAVLVNLILSDVPGDNPGMVGSGPTVPVKREEAPDLMAILEEMDIVEEIPATVRNHISRHSAREVNPPDQHRTHIIGSAELLAEKIQELAEEEGLQARTMSEPYTQDVETVAKKVIGDIRLKQDEDEPVLLIYYGESTLHVNGDGKGGRNQELALYAAREIDGMDKVTWLSVGTDGIDGPTDAAGAVVDGRTLTRARALDLDPELYLENNDSYHFHDQVGTLMKTGPTGNNLMDLQMVLVQP